MTLVVVVLLVLGAVFVLRGGRGDVGAPPGLASEIAVDSELREEVGRLHVAIERAPRSGSLRLELAMVLHANELAGLAVEAYEQALALGGDQTHILHLTAMARERTGDLEAAVTTMQRVLSARRPPLEAFWRQAQWLQDLGRLDEAAKVIDSGLRIHPDSVPLHLVRASVLLDRRDAAAARRILLDHDLITGGYAGHAQMLLARAALQLGEDEEAEHALQFASSARPVWPDAQGAQLAQHRLGAQRRQLMVSRLMREGQYARALPLLQELYAEDASDPRTVNMLAAAQLRLRRVEEAVTLLREAAVRHPNHYGTHLNLASALRDIDRVDRAHLSEAYEHVLRALALRPAAAEAHELCGSLLARLGRPSEAVESYLHAFHLDARVPLRLLRAALLQRELGRWADAAESFARAEALLTPPVPDAQMVLIHLGLAHCLIELGSLPDAEARLDRAAALLDASDARLAALRDLHARRSLQEAGSTTNPVRKNSP